MERNRIPDKHGHRCRLPGAGRTCLAMCRNRAAGLHRADREDRPANNFGNMARSDHAAVCTLRAGIAAECLEWELLVNWEVRG